MSPMDEENEISPSRRLNFVERRRGTMSSEGVTNVTTPINLGQSQVPLSVTSIGAVTSSEQRASRNQRVSWGSNAKDGSSGGVDEDEEDETEEEGPGQDDTKDNSTPRTDEDEFVSDTTYNEGDIGREDDRANVVSDDQRFDDEASRGRMHPGDITGGRRSNRVRYPPLAYWKNERFVYERPNDSVGEVLPTVAGVSERSKTPVAPNRSVRPSVSQSVKWGGISSLDHNRND